MTVAEPLEINTANLTAEEQAVQAKLSALAELARAQAKKTLSKIPLLGLVTWLMLQQQTTRHMLISELEWRVMPALLLDQAKLYFLGAVK